MFYLSSSSISYFLNQVIFFLIIGVGKRCQYFCSGNPRSSPNQPTCTYHAAITTHRKNVSKQARKAAHWVTFLHISGTFQWPLRVIWLVSLSMNVPYCDIVYIFVS